VLWGKLALRTDAGNFDCQARLLPIARVKRQRPFNITVLAENHPCCKAVLANPSPTPRSGILAIGNNQDGKLAFIAFVQLATTLSSDHGCPVSILTKAESVLLGESVDSLFMTAISVWHRTNLKCTGRNLARTAG
jgi:hypothetical protein